MNEVARNQPGKMSPGSGDSLSNHQGSYLLPGPRPQLEGMGCDVLLDSFKST